MIVLVSLIVLLRGLPRFHDFLHGASHPYIPIHSIELVPHMFDGSRKPSYAYAYTRRLAQLHCALRLIINHALVKMVSKIEKYQKEIEMN